MSAKKSQTLTASIADVVAEQGPYRTAFTPQQDFKPEFLWSSSRSTSGQSGSAFEVLEGAAGEVIIVPDGLHVTEQMRYLGTTLGYEDRAEELINKFHDALAAGKGKLGDDCNVSVAAIYPGPSVAIFREPIWEVPTTIVGLGCSLIPSAETINTDQNGRAYISLEQLALIEGERLILLQSDTIEGERTSVNQIAETPLWNQLPAVLKGQVYEFDRLGYPGLSGQIRFINDLIASLNS